MVRVWPIRCLFELWHVSGIPLNWAQQTTITRICYNKTVTRIWLLSPIGALAVISRWSPACLLGQKGPQMKGDLTQNVSLNSGWEKRPRVWPPTAPCLLFNIYSSTVCHIWLIGWTFTRCRDIVLDNCEYSHVPCIRFSFLRTPNYGKPRNCYQSFTHASNRSITRPFYSTYTLYRAIN